MLSYVWRGVYISCLCAGRYIIQCTLYNMYIQNETMETMCMHAYGTRDYEWLGIVLCAERYFFICTIYKDDRMIRFLFSIVYAMCVKTGRHRLWYICFGWFSILWGYWLRQSLNKNKAANWHRILIKRILQINRQLHAVC